MCRKYYMSSIQKRLYIINQVESGISYNTPKIFSVTGSIDRDKMKEAFEKLVDRYELLRTTFEDDGDSFYQVIHEEVDCVVQDFSSDKMLEDIVNEFLRPFELSKAPLMRIGIVRGIEREYLIVDFHHIICDAASVYIYMEDLLSFYGGQTLEPLELQYKDYAAWQLQKDMSDAKEFWENALKVEPERVDLKTDYLRPNEFKTAGNTYHEFSNSSLNEKVKKMCSQYNLSEFAVCLAGFFSFLARYVSQKNITLGIPMANRMHEATFDMPGMFVNTVVISEDVDVSISFMEFAHKIQDDLYQVLEYQDYPFDSLVEYLKVQRDPSRNPLFDIMFVYEGGSDGGRLATEDFSLEEVKEFGYNQAKFDLTFSVFGENDNYDISWEYCTELFGEKTIEYMHNIFKIYFSNLLDNSTSAMNDCALLDEREETHIFEKLEYKPHQIFKKSLLNVFEDNVRDIPEKLALMEKNRVMTFAELDAISSRIANYIKRNLQCERPVVAMLFDRSIDTIVTILAVLKSGAAFLPIEPSLPIERINYILKNSEAECVITNIKRNEDFFCKVIEFEEIKVLSKKENSVCDCQKLDENRLVYIIYTSGSTGNPKGVGINESSLMNYLDWAALEYIHGSEDCFGFYSPLSFDLTITSVFLPLLHGLSMHIYYADDYASSLMDLIEENKVTILKLTPSHMKMINQMDIENTNIHTFIVGGEELTVQTATETEEKINHSVSIINEYGPTEATIGCCYHKFDVDNDVTNVSIGRPIANTQLYVLDEQRNMLPYGVTGELYIAGEGLAVGYYNNEKMTNEKFVENPFESGKKMYATGDLAYKNFDGKYTYCGRKDTQTKLRGFRIELEEVEKIARREADASEAFAMIYKNNESDYLCAYLVGGIKDFEIIKEKMRKYLPDYMVPSFFVTVDQIPLTTNGKVDKKRLPMPDITIGREYIAPRTAKEEELLSVFSEVLGVKIGLGDYFFEVGGDSIKAIRVVSKIKEKGYKISLREIMSRQPMEKTISTVREKESASVEYKEMCGKYENSFIQEKFWNSKLAIPEHFNQSVLLEAANGVTGDIIGKCFEKLVKNHDMLRAKFPEKVLEIKNNTEDRLFGLQEFYFSDEGVDYETIIYENTKSLNASFDLANGPLIKALLLRFQTKTFLYITIHHLIVDSVSWGILLDDLNSYYGELIEDKEEYKPIRSASYAEWNNNLKDLNHSISVLREIDYWDRIEEYIGNNIEEYSYSRTDKLMLEPIEFDEGITKLLISKAILPYKMEVKDIIITALLRAMKKVYNDSNQVISMESHGRQNDYINIDIDRTIGWFTSFYPVMFEQIGEEQSQDLVTVKETMYRVPNHGNDYSVLKYSGKLESDKECLPLVNFNYQGNMSATENSKQYFNNSKLKYAEPMAWENIFGSPISLDGVITDNKLEIVFTCVERLADSLKVRRLIDIFQNELIDLVDFCTNKHKTIVTPMDLGCPGMSHKDFAIVQEIADTEDIHIEQIYPLTPLQEGMLYESLNEKNNDYTIQAMFEFNVEIDIERLKQTLSKLFNRHEVLRTHVVYEKLSKPYQIIMKDSKFDFTYFDVVSNRKTISEIIEKDKEKDKEKGFSFDKESLVRFKVFRLGNDHYIMVMTYHHILIDGWSTGVMLKDLTDIYNNPMTEIHQEGKGVFNQYVKLYEQGIHKVDREYWEMLLGDFEGANTIAYKNNSDANTISSENIEWSTSEALYEKLKIVAAESEATINTVVEYVWGKVLQSYSGSNDAVFGKVVSGREAIDRADDVVGLYINTIPVRVKSNLDGNIQDALRNMQIQGISSMEHSNCSLAEIQKITEYKEQLIKTIVVFENFYIAADNVENKTVNFMTSLKRVKEETNYDLTLTAEVSNTLHLDIMYNANLYDLSQIELIRDRFNVLIEQICGNSMLEERLLEGITTKEKTLILQEFNSKNAFTREDTVFWDCFLERAGKHGKKNALECGEQSLTYSELCRLSGYVAKNLSKQGIFENDIVALEMHNSIEMIVAILGIWRMGATYVPIDPNYPESRKKEILEDCKPKAIVCNVESKVSDYETINITSLLEEEGEYYGYVKNGGALAYVLYTSGTTGKPKGVMVTQSNIYAYIQSFTKEFDVNVETKILQQGTYTFDVFVEEVFPALVAGGTVVIYPKEDGLDFKELSNYVTKHYVDIISCSPLVLNEINLLNMTPNVKIYISGGDELRFNHYTNLISRADVYNTYGPTETTVCATYYKVQPEDKYQIPIGEPIADSVVYILSENKLCGINSLGEICIGGTGVSKGYLNNTKLTEEKFIKNPYGEGMLYKTGDLGRWREDGNILFEGRIDNQIKIRGYRVELSEIENIVKDAFSVAEVVALVRISGGEKVICLYVQDDELGREEIHKELEKRLPIYLVPSRIEVLSEIPMKTNGKINIEKLTIPDVISSKRENDSKVELDDKEKLLVKIFSQVLEEKTSFYDDFFELGGHSLNAARLINEIDEAFGVHLKISDVFRERTPEKIYEVIKKQEIIPDSLNGFDDLVEEII